MKSLLPKFFNLLADHREPTTDNVDFSIDDLDTIMMEFFLSQDWLLPPTRNQQSKESWKSYWREVLHQSHQEGDSQLWGSL